ncbi:ABC transporter permease [Pseudomonas kairouanensis]|uniref:ABC transporter permease n=1 Tax=Pseudomonas kairouanensis TaxID=2293832 RepID=A0A4Z0B006_9PSED|nr:ABC-2 transporter permease [Pseudomonas kairouanensis]TFY92040.1 ABC transporter permease [Pseudomonas kairouanensis]
MNRVFTVFRRQLANYLCAPSTYLSITAFLLLSAVLGLQTHQWLEQGSRHLQAFFQIHPWLYLLLIPTLSTQLLANEHESGFVDFLATLPLKPSELVVGKFFAAWVIAALALLLTFPLVIMINVFGTADNLVIASQFLASWLLAGSYLSVGFFICALTHQRLVIFLLTLCLLLIAGSLSSVLDALEHQTPIWIIDSLTSLSPFLRFAMIDHGSFILRDGLYFISMMVAFLTATIVLLNYKRR